MRIICLTTLLGLLVAFCQAQVRDHAVVADPTWDEIPLFIQWYRANYHLDNDIVLLDSATGLHVWDILASEVIKMEHDSVDFTPAELKEIRRKMTDPYFHIWTIDWAGTARIITRDTLDAIFNKPLTDSWKKFNQTYGSGYHQFSAPLFLRNFTLCIFYADYSCGMLCGHGELALYRKMNGQWKLVKSFGMWIS